MDLQAGLELFFRKHAQQKILIAYSGGLDSHVLLTLCHEFRQTFQLELRAVHINHGLSVNAEVWQAHCEKVCKELEIDFVTQSVHVPLQSGESLEALAREKRYAAIAKVLLPDELVLTAHHEEDQAETFLLQLMRGAGVKGLSAMPHIKSFANGWLARPLLAFSKSSLEKYAKEKKLNWIEDESNDSLAYQRNYLRHQVLPLCEAIWPSVSHSITRSAGLCAEANDLLDELATDLLLQCKGSVINTLSIRILKTLSDAKQRLVIRKWIEHLGFSAPHFKKLKSIQWHVLKANPDRTPLVAFSGIEVRRFKDDLYVFKALPKIEVQKTNQSWDFQTEIHLGEHHGHLSSDLAVTTGLNLAIETVNISYRQGGETIRVRGRGSCPVKKILQESHIPPWERSLIPLLYVDNRVACIPGIVVDEAFATKENEIGRVITWHKSPNLV